LKIETRIRDEPVLTLNTVVGLTMSSFIIVALKTGVCANSTERFFNILNTSFAQLDVEPTSRRVGHRVSTQELRVA